jgi:hypothetical protein
MLLDLPDELIERLKRANIAASCGEIVERFMENPISPPWKELKRWLFLISLMSGWNRLTFIVRRCIQPTLDEWLALPLPAPLFSLYFILRPFKLLVDHVPRILKRLLLGGYDMRLNIRS